MSKITVKHFLNLRQKPLLENNIEEYPIFVSIIYNRHTIRKRSLINKYVSIDEFDSNKFKDKKIQSSLKIEKDIIYKVVELFELEKSKNNLNKNYLHFSSQFSYTSKNEELNLLNSYINYYTSNVYETILDSNYNNFIKKDFEEKINKSINFSENEDLINADSFIDLLNDKELLPVSILDIYDDKLNLNFDSSQIKFILNNYNLESKKAFILNSCYINFLEDYSSKRAFWGILFFELKFDYNNIFKKYYKYIMDNSDYFKPIFEIMSIEFSEKNIKNHIKYLEELVNDKNYSIKYRY